MHSFTAEKRRLLCRRRRLRRPTRSRCSSVAPRPTSAPSARRPTAPRRPRAPAIRPGRRRHLRRRRAARPPLGAPAPGPSTAGRRPSGAGWRRRLGRVHTTRSTRWTGRRRGRLWGGRDATSGHRGARKRPPRPLPSYSVRQLCDRERKCAENYSKRHSQFVFLNCNQHSLVISNHNSFRVLFDKIASVYYIWKNILIFLHWK